MPKDLLRIQTILFEYRKCLLSGVFLSSLPLSFLEAFEKNIRVEGKQRIVLQFPDGFLVPSWLQAF